MNRTILVSLPVLLALVGGCGTEEPRISPVGHGQGTPAMSYLKDNASGYDWFANASDGYAGVPLILLRSLPDLAPDIWGKSEEQFASFGFIPNTEKPNSPLPLGLSWDSMDSSHPPTQLHPVALTCGRVILRGCGSITAAI